MLSFHSLEIEASEAEDLEQRQVGENELQKLFPQGAPDSRFHHHAVMCTGMFTSCVARG